MNNQSVQEITQKLVPAFHIFWMVFTSENGTYLAFSDLKINKGTNMYNVIIPQFEGYS